MQAALAVPGDIQTARITQAAAAAARVARVAKATRSHAIMRRCVGTGKAAPPPATRRENKAGGEWRRDLAATVRTVRGGAR